MGIEGRRYRVSLGRDGILGLGVEQDLPQAFTGGFMPFAEDDVLLGAKDGNDVSLVEDFADIFAEGGDAHKVLGALGTGLGTCDGERVTATSGEEVGKEERRKLVLGLQLFTG